MKRIFYPDHTEAISGVSSLVHDFAGANGFQACAYRLEDLKALLRGEEVTELQALLREGPVALFTVPTTISIDERLYGITKAEAFATASTGTDHVDFRFLRQQGLPFFSAPGENALSVVEYVLSALPLMLDPDRLCDERFPLQLGIIGYGRIGSRLAAVAGRLGWTVRAFDPPLFGSSENMALDCDVITFHVPLTREGPYATEGMVTEEWMDRAREKAVWINAARGPILSPDGLLRLCHRFPVVLDVFPVEPPRPAWIDAARLVSPHVAGYSWRARFAGVYRVLRDFAAARGLRMPLPLERYRPENFALSALDFLEAESAALKASPESFSRRRNRYPSRSSYRDEMGGNGLDVLKGSRKRYFEQVFEAWKDLHLY